MGVFISVIRFVWLAWPQVGEDAVVIDASLPRGVRVLPLFGLSHPALPLDHVVRLLTEVAAGFRPHSEGEGHGILALRPSSLVLGESVPVGDTNERDLQRVTLVVTEGDGFPY